MIHLFFRRRRIKSDALLIGGGFLLALLITIITLLCIFGAEQLALPLSLQETLHKISIPFARLPFMLGAGNIHVDTYTITQSYTGDDIHTPLHYAHGYLLVLAIAYALILAAITYMRGFLFFICLGVWTCVFYTFNFHQIAIFGWQDYMAFLLLVIPLVSAASCFQRYDILRLWQRAAIFLLLFLLEATLIHHAAQETLPFYTLAHYGYAGSLGLTVLFSFVCAHEFIYLILWLSPSAQQKRNLLHFGINSTLYLGYLVLTYCKNILLIDWDIVYLNAFVLFIFSASLGFWGLRQQQPLYGRHLPYYPFALAVYIGLYMVSMSTIAFHFTHLNTPAIEVIEDAVIFGHISFGVCFLFYVFNMFKIPIARGLAVWKVVYKEKGVQFVRLGGLFFIIVLAYAGNYAAYYQIFAGYYNGLGDVYKKKNNLMLARGYYKAGAGRAYNNYKSNSALANDYQRRGMTTQAALYYTRANQKHSMVSSYLNLSEVLVEDNAYFKSIFSLQEGLKRFPHSPVLHNNLGVRFMKKNYVDSAIFHLKKSATYKKTVEVSQSNLSFLYNEYPDLLTTEEILNGLQSASSMPNKNNWLVLGLQKNININTPYLPVSLSKSTNHRAYAYNQILAAIKGRSPAVPSLLAAYAEDKRYTRSSRFLHALHAYEERRTHEALRTMEVLQGNASYEHGYFLSIMGMWAMKEGAYATATTFFERAYKHHHTASLPHHFLSLLLAGDNNSLRAFLETHKDTASEAVLVWMQQTHILLNAGTDWQPHHNTPHEMPTIYLALYKDSLPLRKKESLIDFYKDDKPQQTALWLYMARDFMQKEQYEKAIYCAKNGMAQGVTYEEAFHCVDASARGLMGTFDDASQNPIITSLNQHLTNENTPSDSLVAMGKRHIFNEGVAISIVAELNKRGLHEAGYEVLLEGIELHAFSHHLLKAYALQALHMGVEHYGNDALELLKTRLDSEQFTRFEEEYTTLQTRIKQEDTW